RLGHGAAAIVGNGAIVTRDDLLDRSEDLLDRRFARLAHGHFPPLVVWPLIVCMPAGRRASAAASEIVPVCAGVSTVRVEWAIGLGSCSQSKIMPRTRL